MSNTYIEKHFVYFVQFLFVFCLVVVSNKRLSPVPVVLSGPEAEAMAAG